MELSEFDTKDTADIAVLSPKDGKPTDWVITIHGVYSPLFSKVFSEFKKRSPDAGMNELDAKALAGLTVGWSGLTSGGKAVKFSKSQAENAYSKPFVRQQMINKIMLGEDFLGSP